MSEIDNDQQRHPPAEDGSLRVRQLGSNALLFQVSGHLSQTMAKSMIERAQRLIEEIDRVHAFHDWEDVTGYDNSARLELTGFMFSNRHHFISAHLLVTEQIVAFGVEVANIVLTNKINVHSERESFQRALDATVGA